MKRIISASYKDDTPAFHSEKFFADYEKGETVLRTKAGNARISLRPDDVFCFVFWTKCASLHFMQNMDRIRSPFYFQWTITGYEKDIEPNVPDKEIVINRFRNASDLLGNNNSRVIWRYDPILISHKYTVEYHKKAFEKLCDALEGYTQKCVVSFMDEYGKIKSLVNSGVMRAPTLGEIHELAEFIAETADKHGITVQTCSEGQYDLTAYGIKEAPCVDAEFIENEFGVLLPDSIKKPNSFRRCLCAVNTDIGEYHTCKHDCAYCYAK